jgi:hypothetical protein
MSRERKTTGQTAKTAGASFNQIYQLYVGDGNFLFTNKVDTIKGAEVIHDHFAAFGLKMHIGRNGGKAKTDAMCCPQSLQADKYLKLDLDEKVPERDGYITFTRHFKCLGLWISDTLQDDNKLGVHSSDVQESNWQPITKCT